MKELLDRISSYNILNYLIPGAIFWYMYPIICGETLPSSKFVEELFGFYFAGMIIYGVGSIIIEPIFRKAKIVTYADYKDYIKASKDDIKLETLSESNNAFRTMISLAFILGVSKIYVLITNSFPIPSWVTPVLLLISLIIIFSLLYKKRTDYIRKRVEKYMKEIEQTNNTQ